ncbi:hypothetical protein Hanom_Chr17g01575891 [Helianthus anomalus]
MFVAFKTRKKEILNHITGSGITISLLLLVAIESLFSSFADLLMNSMQSATASV